MDLIWKDQVVGTAEAKRQGLYYKISCSFDRTGYYELIVRAGEKKVNLGLCIPQGEGFGLVTRIPVKKIGGEPDGFFLLERGTGERFAPVEEGKPFAHIGGLRMARFSEQEGREGVTLPEEALQDSDQSP